MKLKYYTFLEEFINALENFYNKDTSGKESNKEDK